MKFFFFNTVALFRFGIMPKVECHKFRQVRIQIRTVWRPTIFIRVILVSLLTMKLLIASAHLLAISIVAGYLIKLHAIIVKVKWMTGKVDSKEQIKTARS